MKLSKNGTHRLKVIEETAAARVGEKPYVRLTFENGTQLVVEKDERLQVGCRYRVGVTIEEPDDA